MGSAEGPLRSEATSPPPVQPQPAPTAPPSPGVTRGAAQAPTDQHRAICVAITHSGKRCRIEGDSVSDFLEELNDATIAWVNFAVDDLAKDGELIATMLGFSGSMVPSLLMKREMSHYEDMDSEVGLRLPVVVVKELNVQVNPLLVLVRRGLVLTLHERGKVTRMQKMARYADTFMRKIHEELPWNDKLTIVLTRILDENNTRNFDGLRTIEDEGDRIGASLATQTEDRNQLGMRIYEMKHALVQYLNALWASLDVIQSLRYGDAEVISDDETLLARVGILADDVTRHIQLSEHMSEVLASGLEVVQSIYNNQLQILNNRLALAVTWLTLLGTAVLVPNTIGTVVPDPFKEKWWYWPLLVAATVLSTGGAYWWMRRNQLGTTN